MPHEGDTQVAVDCPFCKKRFWFSDNGSAMFTLPYHTDTQKVTECPRSQTPAPRTKITRPTKKVWIIVLDTSLTSDVFYLN